MLFVVERYATLTLLMMMLLMLDTIFAIRHILIMMSLRCPILYFFDVH